MSKKTILFADNNVRFLNEQVEFLEAEGFQVLRAASPREAREKLTEKHIHVAIVDMRLKNDDDANDISGLDFAKDEAYAHISKIMITAYPSWEYAAKILESSEASQILQMLAKPEAETNTQLVEKTKGPFVILDAVEAAFRKIPLNWDLAIRWSGQQTVSVSHLISSIAPQMPLLARYMDEMEDLLRRLFVGSKQINVGDILTGDGGKVYLPIL